MASDARRKILFIGVEVSGFTGRELQPTQSRPIEREFLGELFIETKVTNQRHVPDAHFTAAPGQVAVIPVNHRQVELEPNSIVEIVAREKLGGGTVDILIPGVRHLPAVHLKGVEIGELLGDTAEKALAASTLCLRRSVN